MKPDPAPEYLFSTSIPIRITDINYGGHVGNDTVLSIIHEARMAFLSFHGYSEMDLGGPGLIMKDVSIQFKKELFYGDVVIAWIAAGAFSKVSFELYYKLEKKIGENMVIAATAKTGMVCYDYGKKKIAVVPEEVRHRLSTKSE